MPADTYDNMKERHRHEKCKHGLPRAVFRSLSCHDALQRPQVGPHRLRRHFVSAAEIEAAFVGASAGRRRPRRRRSSLLPEGVLAEVAAAAHLDGSIGAAAATACRCSRRLPAADRPWPLQRQVGPPPAPAPVQLSVAAAAGVAARGREPPCRSGTAADIILRITAVSLCIATLAEGHHAHAAGLVTVEA